VGRRAAAAPVPGRRRRGRAAAGGGAAGERAADGGAGRGRAGCGAPRGRQRCRRVTVWLQSGLFRARRAPARRAPAGHAAPRPFWVLLLCMVARHSGGRRGSGARPVRTRRRPRESRRVRVACRAGRAGRGRARRRASLAGAGHVLALPPRALPSLVSHASAAAHMRRPNSGAPEAAAELRARGGHAINNSC